MTKIEAGLCHKEPEVDMTSYNRQELHGQVPANGSHSMVSSNDESNVVNEIWLVIVNERIAFEHQK